MQIIRNEIRTGILVILSIGALVMVLLYLGAPGVFTPMKTFRIYFNNAGGLRPGAPVMLAGRKIGQVTELLSPVPRIERPAVPDGAKYETVVVVQVEEEARIYRHVIVTMQQNGLLGEQLIDFTGGSEASGFAPDGSFFLGVRAAGLAEAVPQVLEKLDPVIKEATKTMQGLQKTAANLNTITEKGSDFDLALKEFRKLGSNLSELSGPGGSLQIALGNVEKLTSQESSLNQSLRNIEQLTSDLSENKDIELTLNNFRQASEKLNSTVSDIGPQFSTITENAEQFTDTLKRQPWRLIWPSTKKYPETDAPQEKPPTVHELRRRERERRRQEAAEPQRRSRGRQPIVRPREKQ